MTSIEIFHSEEDIKSLTDGLLDTSLPKERWTHEAHLAAAYELLHRHSEDDLEKLMPGIIRRYNDATDTPNTDNEGYHETITLFYIRLISHFIESLPRGTDYLTACNSLISGPCGEAYFPLRYYSKDRLFSREARKIWVDPDLKNLEFSQAWSLSEKL